MIRLVGTSPSGKPRVLDIRKTCDDEQGITLAIHPPDSDTGWDIKFSREQIMQFIDFILISDDW